MRDQRQKPLAVFSVINCICFDQRVQKMAAVLNSLGAEILIVGRRKEHRCESLSLPFRTYRFRMIFRQGFIFYMFFNIRLFFYLLFHRSDILVANDLDTLLPNFLVSKLKGIPLVYDSHEFFTGVPELNNRDFVRGVWTTLEKMILPKLRYMMTVSEPIAEEYSMLYGVSPVVVRNAGRLHESLQPFKRKELGIPENDLLVILQGAGINIDKGAEELVDAVGMTEGVSLLVVGMGDVFPELIKRAEVAGTSARIKFVPPVHYKELARYTKAADLGMSLEKDTSLNYFFSLSNKFFDYIAAGIPVVAGNIPGLSKIIHEYNCGIVIKEISADEIAAALRLLKNDRNLLKMLRNNSIKASESLNWTIESKKAIEFYSKILTGDGKD